MTIELLDKARLSIINRKLKYPLAIAEKDYFLALVSKIIYESELREKLIFKGGTALYHTYLPQLRFSEDLDFSANQSEISIEEVKQVFTPYKFLDIKKGYVSQATIKIERLLYTGPLEQPNSLKVDIDFLQNVVLQPNELAYKNEYGVITNVKVMDIKEMAAEKIRAMSDRVRYRDFYDFLMIIKKLSPDLSEIIKLVRLKEIRKPISISTIRNNWSLAKKDKANELQSIYYSENLAENEIESYLRDLDIPEIKG